MWAWRAAERLADLLGANDRRGDRAGHTERKDGGRDRRDLLAPVEGRREGRTQSPYCPVWLAGDSEWSTPRSPPAGTRDRSDRGRRRSPASARGSGVRTSRGQRRPRVRWWSRARRDQLARARADRAPRRRARQAAATDRAGGSRWRRPRARGAARRSGSGPRSGGCRHGSWGSGDSRCSKAPACARHPGGRQPGRETRPASRSCCSPAEGTSRLLCLL